MAKTVDTEGRVIVLTTTKEHAELKRDQILAYGKDDTIRGCKGSMHATIEARTSPIVEHERTRCMTQNFAPSLSAARSTNTRPNTCAKGLLGIGYEDAGDGESAELCIVNTCTVTAEGDAKSRQTIRRLAKRNPGAKIVVMGCYATRAPHEVAALPGVSQVVTDKRELPDLLGRFGVTDIPTGISGFGRRHRAYVKVQDGCMLRCSFCIIPYVRPQLTSRPVEHILEEVRRLVDRGYREVVLTGIHLGHYGVDWNRNSPKRDWVRLSHLVRANRRVAGRLPRAALEHRGDRSDARAGRRAGR